MHQRESVELVTEQLNRVSTSFESVTAEFSPSPSGNVSSGGDGADVEFGKTVDDGLCRRSRRVIVGRCLGEFVSDLLGDC